VRERDGRRKPEVVLFKRDGRCASACRRVASAACSIAQRTSSRDETNCCGFKIMRWWPSC